MEPPKELYLIRDAANPKKILGDIASEKPMFSDDIKYIRADLVNPNDLEKAAKEYTDGKSWAKENYLTPYIREAFIAGAKWDRIQMMKEAVEGTVHNFSSNKPHPTVLVDARGFNQGDKVRVIVLPNEDEK